MIRNTVVAGAFYPGSRSALMSDLKTRVVSGETRKKVIGLVSPHAGYIYSGNCAGKGFGSVEVPDTVILLGVNHHGIGHPYAIDGNDSWSSPLGEIMIDTELRDQLMGFTEIFEVDSVAAIQEHSLEVQVPFIQYNNPNAKILPISISSIRVEELMTGGREISRLIRGREDVLIIASSDMSHYISAEAAEKRDQLAIDKILALDPEGLFSTVRRENITMCGVAPTTMMMSAALELGAEKAEVLDYTNSGIASGDFQQVVAYLCAIVY